MKKFSSLKGEQLRNQTAARDDEYCALISAVIRQAVFDYGNPSSFSASGTTTKVDPAQAARNKIDLERFFESQWCEQLCDGIGFPVDALQNKGRLKDAGRRMQGKWGKKEVVD